MGFLTKEGYEWSYLFTTEAVYQTCTHLAGIVIYTFTFQTQTESQQFYVS